MRTYKMKNPQVRKINKTGILFLAMLLLVLMISLMVEEPEERTILLSFDVKPVDGKETVLEVLEVLEEEKVKGTFFVTGKYAEKYPGLVKRIAENHEVGSHGYTHKKLTEISQEEKREEIVKSKEKLEEITEKMVIGFRAPYTMLDQEAMNIIDEEYLYEASRIKGLGWMYPEGYWELGEVPVSSFLGIPMKDVIWLYYLKMPGPYFAIMKNKKSGMESYLFHPHHIVKRKGDLKTVIKSLKKENVRFITHSELIKAHGG